MVQGRVSTAALCVLALALQGGVFAQETSAPSNPAPAPAPAPGFQITLMNMGAPAEYAEVFAQAAAKWESIITADLTDFEAADAPKDGWFGGYFKSGDYFGPVDDVVIGFRVADIDGVGGTLAQSGPNMKRTATSNGQAMKDGGIPISGTMEFDIADSASGFKDGSLLTVITHEMGHVLGIGTVWPSLKANCANTCDVYDEGATGECYASTEYKALGLEGVLRVESKGSPGDGTYCGHWSESLLTNELMTGILDPAVTYNPLTRITIGGLEDLGYTVDFSKADPLKETASLKEARQQREAAIIAAGELPFSAKKEILRLHDDILQRPVREHIQRRFR